MKRFLSLILVVVMALACVTSCEKYDDIVPPTNEELIAERIETFLTAYNTGDMEAVLECLDAKTRNAFQAMLNLLGGLAGAAAGFDVDLSDLFSLGVSTTQGDFMELKITDITVIDEATATATTILNLKGAGTQTIYFEMVYENNGWYIRDMSDRKPSIVNPDQNNTTEAGILPTWRSEFVDDIACVFYTENGVNFVGLINRDGEIFYSFDESLGVSGYTFIGNGATALTRYDNNGESELVYIVDKNGNVTKQFEEGMRLVAHGDGLALIYQRKDTIAAIEHLYGIIDSTGNWIQPLVDMGTYNNEEHYYAGSGVFAIAVWTWYYNNDYVFWNAIDGNMFYVNNLEKQLAFEDGVAFVYPTPYTENVQIISPFDIANLNEEKEGAEAPAYFWLYSSGQFKAEDLDGKDFIGYSNGYMYYTLEDVESPIYVTSLDQSTVTYTDYPASMLHSIEFVGEHALVTIHGANGNLYFTLIDKNGNQQFEPIETESYNSWQGTHSIVYSDGIVIFKNVEKKYCIANTLGDVIVTDYAYIGGFTDGIARACIGESEWDSDAVWIYINKNNEQVMQTIKRP